MALAFIRRRAALAIAFVAVIALSPLMVRELWPAAASSIPPAVLLLTTLITVFLALAAWRTEWLVTAFFGEADASQRMEKVRNELQRIRATAAVAIFVDALLIAWWVKSIL